MAMRWRWPPENSCGYFVQVLGAQAHLGEHFSGLLALLCPRGVALGLQRFAHDPRHGLAWVQRSVRVLEHHLKVAPGFAQLLAGNWCRSRPSRRTLPEVGASSAITVRARVDLPEPDSPTTPRLRLLCSNEAHAFERLHFGGRAQQVLAGRVYSRTRSVTSSSRAGALARLGCAGSEVMNRNAGSALSTTWAGLRRAPWLRGAGSAPGGRHRHPGRPAWPQAGCGGRPVR